MFKQSNNSLVTLLEIKPGYVNDKGEVYNENGVFIDFPRELGSKTRSNLDISSVGKQFKNKCIACLVHERTNYSYYHWTYETLPKLIYLYNNREELKVDKIYFHYGLFGHPYQRQALQKFKFGFWQVLDAFRLKSLMAKEIFVINLNESSMNPSATLCRTIKTAFIQHSSNKSFRKIYLTREHVKTGRKVVNEFQLRELLSFYGFETVIADNLTVSSQAKLFNESKYIISTHGAALSNIVFCESGTKILELFHQEDSSMWNFVYSRIAEKCSLELIPLPPKQIVPNNNDQHRFDFVADLSAIKAILADWDL